MLDLDSRPCQIGTSISSKTEFHGDDELSCPHLSLLGITLSPEEVDALAGPYVSRALFTDARGYKEPMLGMFEPLVLKENLEGANVTLTLSSTGPGTEITFDACRLKGLTLEAMPGGLTLLSLKVLGSGEDDSTDFGELTRYLNKTVSVEIRGGERVKPKEAKAQQELPINTFGEGEQPAAGDKPKRGRPRKNGDAPLPH